MSLTLEPLKEDELDDYIKVFWDAFEPLAANMILPMIYPKGLQEDLFDCLRHRTLKSTGGDPGSCVLGAKDSVSGEIVGVARWEVVENPPKTKEDMDAKFKDAVNGRQDEPPVAGANEDLNLAFLRTNLYCEMEITAGQPHVTLQLLAIRQNQQRRGIGTLLLKHVLEKADRLHLPVYLDSGISGKALYERFGFQVVSVMPLNALDYGGEFVYYLLRRRDDYDGLVELFADCTLIPGKAGRMGTTGAC